MLVGDGLTHSPAFPSSSSLSSKSAQGPLHGQGSSLLSGLFPEEHSSVRKTALFLCVSSTVTLPSHDPLTPDVGSPPPTTSSAVTPAGALQCNSVPAVSAWRCVGSTGRGSVPKIALTSDTSHLGGPQVTHTYLLSRLAALEVPMTPFPWIGLFARAAHRTQGNTFPSSLYNKEYEQGYG
ncbi:hypothetical protein HJG60_011374 [Phyllostomus discolor]|uniref:Uncharacterized protein n=1 Tax=Phyllostomus discolor TaxID=89673 RepID=A0A834A4L0_9CHIR|nr:hypothetical protein HJG60_011374 [Phyllostomus discolor]